MTEGTYAQIDDLFVKMRLRLIDIRQQDPAATNDLKSLLTQLEDCVETLVIESLRARDAAQAAAKVTRKSGVKKKSRPAK